MMFCYILIYLKKDYLSLQRVICTLLNSSLLAKWQMPLNPSKCEFLQITNKMNPIKSVLILLTTPSKK